MTKKFEIDMFNKPLLDLKRAVVNPYSDNRSAMAAEYIWLSTSRDSAA